MLYCKDWYRKAHLVLVRLNTCKLTISLLPYEASKILYCKDFITKTKDFPFRNQVVVLREVREYCRYHFGLLLYCLPFG